MSKSENQKLKLIRIKEILERETNEEHGLTVEQIIERLKDYGISAERHSVYSDIAILEDTRYYSMDIQRPSGSDKEYRVLSRDKDSLSLDEIKLLIDSVQSSKSISEAATKHIIHKLEKQTNIYDAAQLQRQVLIANRVKSMNGSVHYYIDTIHRAITENKQISFMYMRHQMNKSTVYGRGSGQYIVSPFAMIYTDDHYYLLAYENDTFKHFRIDRMKKVAILEDMDRNGIEAFNSIDLSSYTKYTFGMYGGTIKRVTMIFRASLIDVVLDKFGNDVFITEENKHHFSITVPIAISPQFFGWVFSLDDGVEITYPAEVREQYIKAIENELKRYTKT